MGGSEEWRLSTVCREMLRRILLGETMSRMGEPFLHQAQRTGDNEMDNLRFSVGKRDISVC